MSGSETPAEEPARDVLAAEAFAVPAADPALRHAPIELPDDPTGIAEPHDVLAAEEFAMPASGRGASRLGGALVRRAEPRRRVRIAVALALATLLVLRRVRRA